MKDLQHLKDSDYRTTNWSGGTTKELFIHPSGSNFKKGDFQLRLSIATVEIESSTFTKLPGVHRTLMVLDGQLTLSHEGQHTSHLYQYDQDSFEGDWNTTSKGKVTDFNIMTTGSTQSTIQNVSLISKEKLALTSAYDLQFIYVHKGCISFNDMQISAGESLAIENVSYSKLESMSDAEIILVSIDF